MEEKRKKKTGNFKVDADVRDDFASAVKRSRLTTDKAIEESMKLFTDKWFKVKS